MESEYQKEIVVNGVIYKNFGLAYKWYCGWFDTCFAHWSGCVQVFTSLKCDHTKSAKQNIDAKTYK